MASTEQFYVPQKAQDALVDYHKRLVLRTNFQWDFRYQMEMIDRAYMREQDYTQEQWRAKIANRRGDSNRIQNVTIPVVKPQVAAAVQYQMSVFLDQYPIFGVAADPKFVDAAQQMQAIIKENSIRGGWARELYMFFFDGFKYNLSFLEACWDEEVVADLDSDPAYKGGKEGKPKKILWSGNKISRWDPYNSYWDLLCEPQNLSKEGMYAGTTKLMTKIALKMLILKIANKLKNNEKKAFESPTLLNLGFNGTEGTGYYLPALNPDVVINQNLLNDNWDTYLALPGNQQNPNGIQYRNLYEVSKEYVRIMPAEFGMNVPEPNTPQVWKLWIVNHSVLIAAERQTNAHDLIPVFLGQPSEDGMKYQTKSLAIDAIPFQQTASALMNSVMAARRRAVTDRVAYDPSRVSEIHINNPNPSAKIPVRPAAYGKPVSEAFYQFPYRDDQSGTDMQGIQMVVAMGDKLNGMNQARQGQFVKGNKTDGQWSDVMNNATGQDRAYALVYEAQVFTPLKEVLKINTLQYQQPTTVYDEVNKQEIEIDPVQLRQAVINYEVTDGYLPKEKVLKTDTMMAGAQVIGSSPQLASQFNLGPMWTYLWKTQNVDFSPFQKPPAQVAYEQAAGAWQQAMMEAAKKGLQLSTPQPLPRDFGWDPNTQTPIQNAPRANTQNAGLPPSTGPSQ